MFEPFKPAAYEGKTAGVLGLGRSGRACARLLARKGFKVFGSDARPRRELQAELARMPASFSWEAGGHGPRLLKCGFVVKSPGLSPRLPILRELAAAGVPVVSELEAALAFCRAERVVAVTGTNGKTTTAALAHAVFAAGLARGRKAWLAGNIGIPVSELAPQAGPKDTLVLEVSSYQLEDSLFFAPHAAAILNITADHLDHHGGMEAYIAAKARVFRQQGPQALCVFNADDPLVYKLSRECPSRKLFFGHDAPGQVHARFEGGRIVAAAPGRRAPARLVPPALPGRHNVDNAMAAALLGLSCGIDARAVQKAFKAFRGVEHRIEDAGTVRGIRCVNDSKATNVDSTMVALRALGGQGKRLLLILGGLHKGSPYTPLRPLVESSVKGILTIGAAARKIEEDLGGLVPIFPCERLETAVETALKIGEKGDLLLLSPACASFDQFSDFEARGRRFKELLRAAGAKPPR